jgi:hypothetical protein
MVNQEKWLKPKAFTAQSARHPVRSDCRPWPEMDGEELADARNRIDHATPVIAAGKCYFHLAAHRLPRALINERGNAPVGEDLDAAVDQLHVNEDAIGFPRSSHAQ